ncbi:MAG: polyphosphate kinase 1 [Polyangiaceae bacterium]
MNDDSPEVVVALPPSLSELPQTNAPSLDDPTLYINRELSWLEFNARVLEEAKSEQVPLFERFKFLSIFGSNLDEFFMVRVAGLQAQRSQEIDEPPPDGRTPDEQLEIISTRAHELMAERDHIWCALVKPALAEAGRALVEPDSLSPDEQSRIDKHFVRNIYPVLTPIAIDPVHPFPHVRNKAINLGVLFEGDEQGPRTGLVQVPTSLPRLLEVRAQGYERAFVTLESLIQRHVQSLFPRMKVEGHFAFRVTRNFDIEIDDDEGEDLLLTMQAELRRRERGDAVRLTLTSNVPRSAVRWLCRQLQLDAKRDVYLVEPPLHLGDLGALVEGEAPKQLRDEPFSPQYVPPLRDSEDIFATIREGDLMLHHPYESFEAVVDFLTRAAEDPQVLAIKQTLYRSGGESPLVRALQRAAELGKQVTALVELKARFDEESNIQWARALERSGVNVMYGLVGLKLHAKVLMVVRQEKNGLQRYVHLATGNYNQQTAKLYEDLSIFTTREDIAEDATALFNLLTGYSAPDGWKQLLVAPLGLKEAVLGLIEREARNAAAGKPARVIAKMNALVDPDVVAGLYAASRAGVEIDLLIRGICCLRPGVPGVSERIRVHAVIDRFLEHARVFYFENAGEPEVFCASADWMPRNFERRVEVMFPILDARLKKRITTEILETMRSDDTKGWLLEASGRYRRVRPSGEDGKPQVRSQYRFMELARERAREHSGPVKRKVGGPASVLRVKKKKKRRKP